MRALSKFAKSAFGIPVLRFAAPAYALPAAGAVGSAAGVGAMSAAWPLLAGAAVGLHLLLTVNALGKGEDLHNDTSIEPPKNVAQRQRALEDGFSRLESVEGVKAVSDLVYEYSHLQPLLARRKVTDSIALGQLPALAEETFKQGLSVLHDALDLMEASSAADKERLERENRDIEKEIAKLSDDPTQEQRISIRRERMASNVELLQIMNQQQARIDELLYQSDRCGASLHRTRMELAALRADGSEAGVTAVVDTLRLTISHAKGVQDEMRKLGGQPSS
jgi:hypothetical protein